MNSLNEEFEITLTITRRDFVDLIPYAENLSTEEMNDIIKTIKRHSESEFQSNIESGIEYAARVFNEEDTTMDELYRQRQSKGE